MRLLTLLSLFAALTLAACDSGTDLVDGDDDDVPVPTAYTFDSRFADDQSSVYYGGQVVRNLLVNDLKIRVDGLAKAGAEAIAEDDLLRRYDYEDSYDLQTLTGTGTTPVTEDRYSEIATGKDLVGKIDASPLISVGATADEVIRGYFQQIAANSADASKRGTAAVYTTDEGVDMSQMINKILLGAVPYSQATGTYLETVLDDDNSGASGENAYTEMEHHWDEAYGYFGAARDYSQYGDAEIAGGILWRDSNGDGAIDLSSEYNFTWAGYAAKRDAGGTDVDFSGDLFGAFLEGRTAIVNQAAPQVLAEQRDDIVQTWDRLVAANVIHYINGAISDMADVTQAEVDAKNNEDLNEHWAEAKGFAFALQFNPFKSISDAQLEDLHALLGEAPPYALPGTDASEEAAADLEAARDLLQSVYGFSDENTLNW